MIKKIAVIGVGRMGGGIARNLCRGGFEVTVFDFNPAAVELCTKEGASAADSVGAAVAAESEDVGSLSQPAKPSIKTAAKTAPTAAARYFFVLCLYMRSPF